MFFVTVKHRKPYEIIYFPTARAWWLKVIFFLNIIFYVSAVDIAVMSQVDVDLSEIRVKRPEGLVYALIASALNWICARHTRNTRCWKRVERDVFDQRFDYENASKLAFLIDSLSMKTLVDVRKNYGKAIPKFPKDII